MLPPIMVDSKATVHAKIGDNVVVTTKDVSKVTINNAAVLTVSQPHTDGSATFNAGAKVAANGQAQLFVYGSNQKLLYVVTVVCP